MSHVGMESGHHGLGCGRRSHGLGIGAREPFAFPGTKRRYAPDRLVDIRHSALDIAVDPREIAIRGTVTHTVTALTEGVTKVRLHAGELAIDSVTDREGSALAFHHEGMDLSISLKNTLAIGDESTVTVAYHGTPRRGLYFVQPDDAYPTKPFQAWTQGQDEDSRFWFPCFDHPCEKASTEVKIRVPAGFTAISNGRLLSKTPHDDDTVTWHWKQEMAHSAYLVMVAVGEFDEVVLREGDAPLTVYVPQGRAEDAKRCFERTAAMMDVFDEKFGVRYPYEKYAQVVVEDFIFGGMENTTATTLIDIALFDERAELDYNMDALIAHELAHQWWGDLLTCREWSHAWLNEGFATWSEVLWKEHALGSDEAAYERLMKLETYKREDGGEYRRAIVDRRYDEPIDLFDRHLYEKGGLVLHMLRRELGDDSFFRSIQTYATENRGRSVVTEDLRRSIELATGRDLDWFFDQWVFHAGHPELKVSWKHHDDEHVLHVRVKQTHRGVEGTMDAFRLSTSLRVGHADGSVETRDIRIADRDQSFVFRVEKAPHWISFDPNGDILGTVTVEQAPAANRALLASNEGLQSRIRAARALVSDVTRESIEALQTAMHDTFWGLAGQCAVALGRMRHHHARDVLVGAMAHKHPKVRRAAAGALGRYRGDEAAATALIDLLTKGDASIFVEASAARSLGKTRSPRAKAVLEKALAERDSWAETIRMGCVDGLAALADDSVLTTVIDATAYGKPPRLRSAAIRALAQIARRMERRDDVFDVLSDLSSESDFRIVAAAIAALRGIGDPRAIAVLSGAPMHHPDGRVPRAARAAIGRLKKSKGAPGELKELNKEVASLRERNADLERRLQALELGQKESSTS